MSIGLLGDTLFTRGARYSLMNDVQRVHIHADTGFTWTIQLLAEETPLNYQCSLLSWTLSVRGLVVQQCEQAKPASRESLVQVMRH